MYTLVLCACLLPGQGLSESQVLIDFDKARDKAHDKVLLPDRSMRQSRSKRKSREIKKQGACLTIDSYIFFKVLCCYFF